MARRCVGRRAPSTPPEWTSDKPPLTVDLPEAIEVRSEPGAALGLVNSDERGCVWTVVMRGRIPYYRYGPRLSETPTKVWKMGYEKIKSEMAILDRHVADLEIKLAPDAEAVVQMELLREFLRDKSQLSAAELCAKWDSRFRDFYDAQITVGRLSGAITELLSKQKSQLSQYLKKILGGGITQGGNPEQARDFFYEVWLASVLSKAGFTVALQEPDIVVDGNELSQKIGIACKYPSSEQQIHPHLSKGNSQLAKHRMPGLVALGIDQIVIEQAGLKKYVDFNQGGKNPVEVLKTRADSEVIKIVSERTNRFPSEVRVDELLVTVSLGGLYGTPPKFTVVTAAAIHCPSSSPIVDDIRKIYSCLATLPSEPKKP